MTAHTQSILAALDFSPRCDSVLQDRCRAVGDVVATFACGHARVMCSSHAVRLKLACERAALTPRLVYRYCPDCDVAIRVLTVNPIDAPGQTHSSGMPFPHIRPLL